MKTKINSQLHIEFKAVINQDEIEAARQLFLEYAHSLDIDLAFQDFEREIKSLPGKYGPPDGMIILAVTDEEVAGCIALRKISSGICEMKRLFVRDKYKGLGIGRKLTALVIEEAVKLDYNYIRLDTLSTMTQALNLYKSLGFYDIEPYIYNPIDGAKFMELKLNK